jgi:hypothetical protein
MYFIHSQREDEGNPITAQEWESLVKSDPEMEFSNTVNYLSPLGENITKSGGFYGIWTSKEYPTIQIVFSFENETISVIFDSKTLKKLQEISNKLGGYVYGDIGEEY